MLSLTTLFLVAYQNLSAKDRIALDARLTPVSPVAKPVTPGPSGSTDAPAGPVSSVSRSAVDEVVDDLVDRHPDPRSAEGSVFRRLYMTIARSNALDDDLSRMQQRQTEVRRELTGLAHDLVQNELRSDSGGSRGELGPSLEPLFRQWYDGAVGKYQEYDEMPAEYSGKGKGKATEEGCEESGDGEGESNEDEEEESEYDAGGNA
jgi:hypothetical protein